jgi:hypothetical protein
MLRKDEVVLRVAAGTAFYPVEIFFGNRWLTMLFNRFGKPGRNLRISPHGSVPGLQYGIGKKPRQLQCVFSRIQDTEKSLAEITDPPRLG